MLAWTLTRPASHIRAMLAGVAASEITSSLFPVSLMSAGGLPATGDDRVDAALAGLSRLPGRPADEHVAVLEEVHGRLRDILGELNGGPS